MESKFKLFGHPVHPTLVIYPLGMFSAAVIFDILYLVDLNPLFPVVSFYMIAVGIIGGLVAAIFGLIDWMALPGNSRAKRIGGWHGLGNAVIVVMFAVSWFLRNGAIDYVPNTLALVLSFAGVALALITGWIGGELVYRLSVGVDPGANVNAPSSLTDQPASVSKTKQTTARTHR
jgi:uncharacterized membrane protein